MDYDQPTQTPRASSRYLIVAAVLFVIAAIISYFYQNNTQTSLEKSATVPIVKSAPVAPTPQKAPPIKVPVQAQTLTIESGDTLATVFNRAGLPNSLWLKILRLPKVEHYLDHLQAGNTMTITATSTHQFVSLSYSIDLSRFLEIYQQDNYFATRFIQKPVTQTAKFNSTTVRKNVSQTVKATGLPKPLQHQLTTMLTSGLASIHPGDRINVLYHEYLVGDQKARESDIVAAEITNGSKNQRIVKFTTPNHKTTYYNADGTSAQSPFLKAPVNYRRIGSGFSYSRLDPVKHFVHPHLGVDMDAPRGTPVKAIGDGIVVFCKRFGGYGNAVMIRYGNTYKALYGHLEKFATNLHTNQVVKKGQVVGYVGSTGWATGPHLHFTLYVNDKPVDPLKVKFPHTTPLAEKYRREFFAQENQWFSEMKTLKQSTGQEEVG